MTADPLARVAALALRRRDAAEAYVAELPGLADLAAELVAAEAEVRAAEAQAGLVVHHRLDVRQLATDAAFGALAPLRPSLPFVSSEAAEMATRALVTLDADTVATDG